MTPEELKDFTRLAVKAGALLTAHRELVAALAALPAVRRITRIRDAMTLALNSAGTEDAT